MKKILTIIAGLIFAMPFSVFAGSSLTFSPTSPQTLASNPDPTVTCDTTGSFVWFEFTTAGVRPQVGNANTIWGTNFNGGCSSSYSSVSGGNMSVENGGVAGDITWLYMDDNYVVDPSAQCQSTVLATLAGCKAAGAWAAAGSIQVIYTLTSAVNVPPALGSITMTWGQW